MNKMEDVLLGELYKFKADSETISSVSRWKKYILEWQTVNPLSIFLIIGLTDVYFKLLLSKKILLLHKHWYTIIERVE